MLIEKFYLSFVNKGIMGRPISRNLGEILNMSSSKIKSDLKHTVRRMATHRDLASAWARSSKGGLYSGYGGSGSGSSFKRAWDKWKVPLLFTVGIITFDHYVLPYFFETPVTRQLKRHPEYVVYGIIAANAVGFLLWKTPPGYAFMSKYGLLYKDPRYFRAVSMMGSAFSHQDFWHIAINMFVLYQFGIPVARWMGSKDYLAWYLDASVLSSLGSMLIPILLRRPTSIPSLGASGAVFATFGTFCYLAPNARLALYFVPLPFGAWYVFLGALGYNLMALVGRFATTFDHSGHIAGCIVGIAAGAYVQRQAARRRKEAWNRWRRGGW